MSTLQREQQVTPASAPAVFDRLFRPRKVAVVGASMDTKKVANRGMRFMAARNYAGEVFGVNPAAAEAGIAGMVGTIDDLPKGVDVAVLSVPVDQIIACVAACGRKQIPFAIVFANGFADVGNWALQEELIAIARQSHVRLIGPNCLGVLDLQSNFAGTFSSLLDRNLLIHGDVALVSQSGAVGNSVLLSFQALRIGISCWAATGNEADFDAIEALEYVLDRDDTNVAIGIFEAVHDAGQRLQRLAAQSLRCGKPILLMKTGKSEASRRAAQSHTGKVVGDNEAWRQIIADFGFLNMESLEHIADASLAFSVCRWRKTGAAAILCGSGGTGGIISDDLFRFGVELAALSDQTKSALRAILPKGASASNPVDPTTVTEDVYYRAAHIILEDEGVGTLVLAVNSLARGYSDMPARLEALCKAAQSYDKNVAVTYFSPHDALSIEAEIRLRSSGLLILPTSGRLARAIGSVCDWERLTVPVRPRDRHSAAGTSHEIGGDQPRRDVLSLLDLRETLEEFGIAVVATVPVRRASDALSVGSSEGGGIVLKLESSSIAHKTDAGLVCVGLRDLAETSRQIDRLAKLQEQYGGTIVAQPLILDAVEVVIGGLRDPELGPLVTVGLGGIFVELSKEVAIAICPIDEARAKDLLQKGRLGVMLAGYRGAKACDVQALAAAVSGVSRLLVSRSDFVEFELNPVLVGKVGEITCAVDALAVIERSHDA